MGVGERLKTIRLAKNVTLLEIAEYLGVSEATVQRYESGNIKNLKLDTITKISEYLNTNPAYLMGWTSNIEDVQKESEYEFYPTSVSAGNLELVDTVADYQVEKIKLPNVVMGKWASHKDIKIMRINGESMNKEIPNGSLIAVKPIEFCNLKDGDIVVFNKEYEYSTKIFYNDKVNKRFVFKPNSYDPMFSDHIISYEDCYDLSIEGRVVLWIVEKD